MSPNLGAIKRNKMRNTFKHVLLLQITVFQHSQYQNTGYAVEIKEKGERGMLVCVGNSIVT